MQETIYNAGEDIVQQYKDADLEELHRLLVNWINSAAEYSRNSEFWRNRSGLLADKILLEQHNIDTSTMNEFEKDANHLEVYRELKEFND